ncbi:putative mitochondrial protein, conserved [Ceratobasidium sp. 423]|nr:putative mitochondrial protein, conserved [Ceratobasidium sp. 423]
MQAFAPLRNVSKGIIRPGPPPLPKEEQREFDELVRKAQTPAAATQVKEGEELHPDARQPVAPEFVGDVNPVTGEQGGPKREPVPEGRNDWSYGGRVTDF